MFNPIFADVKTLLLGALTGFVFGFLLQKGGLTRFNVIVGQFLFKDFTVLKTMGTAIVVGSIGVYAMLQMGMIEGLHVKPALLLANTLGGLIFGVGMALLGFCPGTGVAAIGEGSKHAIPGFMGMIAGAAAYAEAYPWIKANILGVADYGKATFVTMSDASPWLFIVALAVIAAGGFYLLERSERGGKGGGGGESPSLPHGATPAH